MVADQAEIRKRFAVWTGRVFEGYGAVKFPWTNVVIAGGFVVHLITHARWLPLEAATRGMDVDLWVTGCVDADGTLRLVSPVIEYFVQWCWYHKRKLHMHKKTSAVLTLQIEGVPMHIQIVACKQRFAYEVVHRFDLSHLEWIYKDGQIYGSAAAIRACETRISQIKGSRRVVYYERVAKALHRGFDVDQGVQVKVQCWGWKYSRNAGWVAQTVGSGCAPTQAMVQQCRDTVSLEEENREWKSITRL